MRDRDLKAAAIAEADELAAEAFDQQTESVRMWLDYAVTGEYDADDAGAVWAIVDAAVNLSNRPADPERMARLRRAVDHARERYIDHASRRGLYEAEAWDTACAKRAEADEAASEWRAEQRAWEAAEAAKRG